MRVALGNPSQQNDWVWVVKSLKALERNTLVGTDEIAKDFTVTGVFVETRTLNTSTATLADVVAFIATFITDIQKGGQNRTGA